LQVSVALFVFSMRKAAEAKQRLRKRSQRRKDNRDRLPKKSRDEQLTSLEKVSQWDDKVVIQAENPAFNVQLEDWGGSSLSADLTTLSAQQPRSMFSERLPPAASTSPTSPTSPTSANFFHAPWIPPPSALIGASGPSPHTNHLSPHKPKPTPPDLFRPMPMSTHALPMGAAAAAAAAAAGTAAPSANPFAQPSHPMSHSSFGTNNGLQATAGNDPQLPPTSDKWRPRESRVPPLDMARLPDYVRCDAAPTLTLFGLNYDTFQIDITDALERKPCTIRPFRSVG